MQWCWLGRVPFAPTVALQERLRAQVASGAAPETLLLCEHDPVITLGRSARREHVLVSDAALAAKGVALHEASRGGDVTYHGPGQLVGYPIFRLRAGVLSHVRLMAAAVIRVLALHGLQGVFRREQPGVWVQDEKICAFGVHVRRRVAMHGFALNVAPDPAHFALIVPCGLHGQRVTSLAALCPDRPVPGVADLVPALVAAFAAEMGRPLEAAPPSFVATLTAGALH